jgi:hypothetical protein
MNHSTTLLNTGHIAAASLLVFGLAGAGVDPKAESGGAGEEPLQASAR